jgi:hypothetical protein
MGDWETKAFGNSLETLAQIALRETGAQGYAFFERSGVSGSLILLARGGAVVPQVTPPARTPALVEYPLRTNEAINASVAFAFGTEAEAAQSRPHSRPDRRNRSNHLGGSGRGRTIFGSHRPYRKLRDAADGFKNF